MCLPLYLRYPAPAWRFASPGPLCHLTLAASRVHGMARSTRQVLRKTQGLKPSARLWDIAVHSCIACGRMSGGDEG
jgi:hypothetical protein